MVVNYPNKNYFIKNYLYIQEAQKKKTLKKINTKRYTNRYLIGRTLTVKYKEKILKVASEK